MVTGVDGDNICEQTACLPNPCQNDGTCQLNDEAIGGYVCQCKEGYTGTDCTLDVDECLESELCTHCTCLDIGRVHPRKILRDVYREGSYCCMIKHPHQSVLILHIENHGDEGM